MQISIIVLDILDATCGNVWLGMVLGEQVLVYSIADAGTQHIDFTTD